MDCIIETANVTHQSRYYSQHVRKTLQFLVPLSIFSFLVTYFSGFPSFFFLFSNRDLIFALFDRNCMFLICNGILAFVAKSSKLTTSSGFEIMKNITEEDHHDHVKQIPEMPLLLKEAENAASMELYVDSPLSVEEKQQSLQQEQEFAGFQKREDEKIVDCPLINVEKQISLQQQQQEFAGFQKKEEEKTTGDQIVLLDSEDWENEDEDEDEEELEEEVINDAQVSTEELNKKFEEFIRRMKEEIRIEARRNTMIAAV